MHPEPENRGPLLPSGYGGGFRSYIVFSSIVVLVSMAGSACGMLLSSFSANPLVGLALGGPS